MNEKRRPARPANLAARALRDGLFKSRKTKSGKTYSRKIKHRKGERDDQSVALLYA